MRTFHSVDGEAVLLQRLINPQYEADLVLFRRFELRTFPKVVMKAEITGATV